MTHPSSAQLDNLALYRQLQKDFERLVANTPALAQPLEEICTAPKSPENPKFPTG